MGRCAVDGTVCAVIVRCVDEQRQDPTTGGPRHRAPAAGPDDERSPSVRRRVDAAPLTDPEWLGRLRADARCTGRTGARVAVRALPARADPPVTRSDRPDVRTGLSRWRAAAGPLVALAVVVAATVVVLGAVDRGGRAEPTAVAAVSASGSVPPGPRVSTPATRAARATQPTAHVVNVPSATVPSATAPALEVPRVLVTGSPVEILEALQEIRGTAFATGRLDLLGDVYPPGSELATADRAAFAGLAPTGGTVAGLGFDLREAAVPERTPVRAVVTALVSQRPVEVVSGASVRRLPGRELGRVRVVLGRPSVTDAWVITASTPADTP